jgi:hypothetical protein
MASDHPQQTTSTSTLHSPAHHIHQHTAFTCTLHSPSHCVHQHAASPARDIYLKTVTVQQSTTFTSTLRPPTQSIHMNISFKSVLYSPDTCTPQLHAHCTLHSLTIYNSFTSTCAQYSQAHCVHQFTTTTCTWHSSARCAHRCTVFTSIL